jgi:hypothetical protein
VNAVRNRRPSAVSQATSLKTLCLKQTARGCKGASPECTPRSPPCFRNMSARSCRHGPGPLAHFNSLHTSRFIRSPTLQLLKYSAAIVRTCLPALSVSSCRATSGYRTLSNSSCSAAKLSHLVARNLSYLWLHLLDLFM